MLLWLAIAKTAGEQPPNAALEQQPDVRDVTMSRL
jgi:hypothetical protein